MTTTDRRRLFLRADGVFAIPTVADGADGGGAPDPHAATHEPGGSDVLQLSGPALLFGRGDSGAGPLQEIGIGTGLSITGTTLDASVAQGLSLSYRFDTATTPPPTARRLQFNAAPPYSGVTAVYVSYTTDAGNDAKRVLLGFAIGTTLYVQEFNDSSKYAQFTVAAPPIDRTTYAEIPVTWAGSGAAIDNNAPIGMLATPHEALAAHATTHAAGGTDPVTLAQSQVTGLVAALATKVDTTGTPAVANALAVFSDADTVRGDTDLVIVNNRVIATKTVDGADTSILGLAGGGLSTQDRGAYIQTGGNEHSVYPGSINLVLGDAPTAGLSILRSGNIAVVTLRGSDGVVTLHDGKLSFPATPKPSADATTLDDYREGFWTVAVTGTSGGSGQSYLRNAASYLKVGRSVTIAGRVTLSVLGTMSGNIRLTGLPFAVATSYDAALSVSYFGGVSGVAFITGDLNSTNIDLYFTSGATSATAPLVIGNLTNNFDLIFSATYIAAN